MKCPTCHGTGVVPDPPTLITTSEELIAALRRDDRTRVYEAATPDGRHGSGRFFISYSGDHVYRNALLSALGRGLLVPLYPDAPSCASWTLPDRAAKSVARRKR